MNRGGAVAGHPLTWALALFFLVVIDVAVTRSPLLWGRASLENTRDITRVVFAHTYRVAGSIYGSRRKAPVRVALLGNSRIWIPAQEAYLQREFRQTAPALDVRVDNLGIFGARVGDLEVLSRHFGRLDPTLAVLTISGTDLVSTPAAALENLPARLLNTGWRDGPIPPPSHGARVDRWLRSIWPLYRFREFTRAAIADLLDPEPDPGPFPDRFESTRQLFDYMHGEKGAEVDLAYRAWRSNPTIKGFVDYLEIGSSGHLAMVRRRVTQGSPVSPHGPALRVLDALLDRCARGPWKSSVLLMPESPLLGQDREGQYHRPGFSERTAGAIRRAAERHGLPFIDGRRWMGAEAFLDFDHLMPDLSGFQKPLAEHIVHAIES